MGDLLKDQEIFNSYMEFRNKLKSLPDKEKFFVIMRYLSEDNRNFFRYRFFLEWFVGGFDKTNQQSQDENGFIDLIRKCDFSNWLKEDLEKLIEEAHKSIKKLSQNLSTFYTDFKKFFGEPKEVYSTDLLIYSREVLFCSKQDSIKIFCYVNILYYSILRCKDEYRGDLIRKLYNLTENSGVNFNKFLFQMILSELVKNDWEKLKEFFWEYNYFLRLRMKSFGFRMISQILIINFLQNYLVKTC